MARKTKEKVIPNIVEKPKVKIKTKPKVKSYKAVRIQVMDHKKGVCFRINVPTPYPFPEEGWLNTNIKAGYLVEC